MGACCISKYQFKTESMDAAVTTTSSANANATAAADDDDALRKDWIKYSTDLK